MFRGHSTSQANSRITKCSVYYITVALTKSISWRDTTSINNQTCLLIKVPPTVIIAEIRHEVRLSLSISRVFIMTVPSCLSGPI